MSKKQPKVYLKKKEKKANRHYIVSGVMGVTPEEEALSKRIKK
jgi:hypothetical protein